tara:strand:+ start:1835 stop:2341 length:507 start_codon:yes stop_codon:yes gene_type:complete
MKQFIILIILVFVIHHVFSQTEIADRSKNIVFAEVAGAGGFGSVNYEREIIQKGHLKFSLRGGLGLYHITDFEMKFNPDLIIPLTMFFYYGKKHHIDVGFGQTISSMVYMDFKELEKKRSYHLHSNLSVGYRYQKSSGGFFFKLSYSPLLQFNQIYEHWGAASFGYGF